VQKPSVSNIVFDTSVILALLKNERVDMELPNLRWAAISAVNVAELWTKFAEGDEATRGSGIYLLESLREVVPFTAEQARLAGELQMQPGVKGLSLGDRACLALALSTGAEVYTGDRVWSRLKLPCTIHQIR
jgi:ribonuclease VapC